MQYSKDIENMICVAKGVSGRFEHGPEIGRASCRERVYAPV